MNLIIGPRLSPENKSRVMFGHAHYHTHLYSLYSVLFQSSKKSLVDRIKNGWGGGGGGGGGKVDKKEGKMGKRTEGG